MEKQPKHKVLPPHKTPMSKKKKRVAKSEEKSEREGGRGKERKTTQGTFTQEDGIHINKKTTQNILVPDAHRTHCV